MKTWIVRLACLSLVLLVQAGYGQEKSITIWWAQWDPAAGLQELGKDFEKETGIETGMKQNGSITVALTESRKEELNRQAALARAFGVEVSEIGPKEIKEKYPQVR